MGILKSCYSVSGESVESAVFELYDRAEAINVTATNPGFDDLLGEPYLEDTDADRIGDRVRPVISATILAKARFSKNDEQRQDGTGNTPDSFLTLTVTASELIAKGLLSDGVASIRANDRLLRLVNRQGIIRVDLTKPVGQPGLYVFEVRPGETGTGTYTILLEKRRLVA